MNGASILFCCVVFFFFLSLSYSLFAPFCVVNVTSSMKSFPLLFNQYIDECRKHKQIWFLGNNTDADDIQLKYIEFFVLQLSHKPFVIWSDTNFCLVLFRPCFICSINKINTIWSIHLCHICMPRWIAIDLAFQQENEHQPNNQPPKIAKHQASNSTIKNGKIHETFRTFMDHAVKFIFFQYSHIHSCIPWPHVLAENSNITGCWGVSIMFSQLLFNKSHDMNEYVPA